VLERPAKERNGGEGEGAWRRWGSALLNEPVRKQRKGAVEGSHTVGREGGGPA
jgi:hypothetical protein